MEMKISVLIITKNEEKMIPGCLKTVKWADEVIVVDTGNTDKTNQIAKKLSTKRKRIMKVRMKYGRKLKKF